MCKRRWALPTAPICSLKERFSSKVHLKSWPRIRLCERNIWEATLCSAERTLWSNKEDLSQHINNIEKNIQKKENKYLKEISENYIKFVQTLNYSRNSASKDFYLIISNENLENFDSIEIVENDLKEKYFKIKECLSRCGNDVIELNEKEEIIKIFYSLLNTRNFLKK